MSSLVSLDYWSFLLQTFFEYHGREGDVKEYKTWAFVGTAILCIVLLYRKYALPTCIGK